jgi:hypothetical protein
MLQRANELLAAMDFAGAAAAFARLAANAEQRNGPRAPFFYLQAGRANMLAGQKDTGYQQIKRGLSIIAQRGNFQRLNKVTHRIINELKQHDMNKEADELATWLKAALPIGFTPAVAPQALKQAPLPTHCPSCGAPVRPDEVDWLDEATAECAFCGSPVRGEN